jgi:hypothetical protein
LKNARISRIQPSLPDPNVSDDVVRIERSGKLRTNILVNNIMRFPVLTVVKISMLVLWAVTPYGLVDRYNVLLEHTAFILVLRHHPEYQHLQQIYG